MRPAKTILLYLDVTEDRKTGSTYASQSNTQLNNLWAGRRLNGVVESVKDIKHPHFNL